MTARPTSIVRAMQLIWLLIAFAAVITIAAVVLSDDLVRAWAGGGGLSADDTRVPPTFTPVVVVLFVVTTSLLLILMDFLRYAHNWARHCLGAGAVLVMVGAVAGIRTQPPAAFVVCAVAALAVSLALLVCLYLPTSTDFLTESVDD